MHALEVIVARNAAAAGREAGHAYNDCNHGLAHRISAVELELSPVRPLFDTDFRRGYVAGRQEG